MKRNTLRVFGGAMLSLALAAATTACGTADTGGGGEAGECTGKIGFMGALSGGNSSIVIPSFNAAKLAFKQFKKKNPDCKVTLQEFDTEGDPAKATPVAAKIANNQEFIGVIGGAFSGETQATKKTYEEAGVTMISQSATSPEITFKDPTKTFHRVVGNDIVQGAAVAKYLKEVLKSKKAFVVDDGTAYGAVLADEVVKNAKDIVTDRDKVQEKQTDFAATISKIKGAGADAVFYAGYANEAGPFLKQLRAEDLDIPFVGGDGLYGADFPKAAGAQSEGAIVTCPCLPAEEAGGNFAKDYKAEYGENPGAYGAEGWDAATIFLEGIKAGKNTREAMEKFVDSYDKKGASKHLKFDKKGDVAKDSVVIWSYKIQDKALVPDQEITLT